MNIGCELWLGGHLFVHWPSNFKFLFYYPLHVDFLYWFLVFIPFSRPVGGSQAFYMVSP